jgi:hypothetical protein
MIDQTKTYPSCKKTNAVWLQKGGSTFQSGWSLVIGSSCSGVVSIIPEILIENHLNIKHLINVKQNVIHDRDVHPTLPNDNIVFATIDMGRQVQTPRWESYLPSVF